MTSHVEILHEHDGGFDYRISLPGLTATCWRRGSRTQVEHYARETVKLIKARARGDSQWMIRMSGGRKLEAEE